MRGLRRGALHIISPEKKRKLTRQFQVMVMQFCHAATAMKCTKKYDARAKFCYTLISNPLDFCRSRCRRRRNFLAP